jgi:hypothetical protein
VRYKNNKFQLLYLACGENGCRGAAAAQLIYGDGLGDPALGEVSRETAGTQNSADDERWQHDGCVTLEIESAEGEMMKMCFFLKKNSDEVDAGLYNLRQPGLMTRRAHLNASSLIV